MPTLLEIRKMSGDMFEAHRHRTSSETTPREVTEELLTFCFHLSPVAPLIVKVIDDSNGLYGWCSDGVAEKVKADGGEHVFGWLIWEWPGVMWTAEFHDNWLSPQGEILDITPKPAGEESVLFVPDFDIPQNFDFSNRPGNRRQRIYREADRVQLLARVLGRLSPGQRAYEMKRAERAGISFESWMKLKLPIDPLPGLIDEVIFACSEHEQYFDTLGHSGIISADNKLIQLMIRRSGSLKALRRALKSNGRTLG